MTSPVSDRTTPHEIAAWIITAALLFAVLQLHLLPALLGGLLVHELIHLLSQPLKIGRLSGQRAKQLATGLLAGATMAGLILLVYTGVAYFRTESDNLPALLQKMADVIESFRSLLPAWIVEKIPHDAEGLKEALTGWLRTHAAEIQTLGKEAGTALMHTLIGMVIGTIIALQETRKTVPPGPLGSALAERAARVAAAFRQVVFAQVRISLINTVFTALYLVLVLPLLGVHMPLTKTLIAVTFVAGLLPVVGNLVSNFAIVMVSLGISLPVAIGSLAFLVIIHKLEYFLNARIVGAHISAHAWELLIAMILMETMFGLPGIAAAPILYAYLKKELLDRGLV